MSDSPLKKDLDQKQILLVVGLLVVLGAVLWFFVLGGGGDEPADLGAPPPVPADGSTPAPATPTESPEPEEGPVETFELFSRRDPFEPVVDTGDGTGIPSGETPSDTPTESPGTGDGVFDDGTSTGDTKGDTTGGSDSTGDGSDTNDSFGGSKDNNGSGGSNVGGYKVKLVDVFTKKGERKAQVQVDSTVYTVDPGEDFAGSFRLVSLSGECASMLFGDDQFTICEGEEILK